MDKLILQAQKNEITEHKIYSLLSKKIKDDNKKILERISKDELDHYNFWKKISNKDVKGSYLRIYFYILLAKILGLSFALKLMENGEKTATNAYNKLKNKYKINPIIKDEQRHEKDLLNIIKEERIEYASSIVLGLNDALVELTGALAGLTFTLQKGKLIAATGFIIGVAASMSMAASGYLSSKEEGKKGKNPLKSAIYTGMTYVVTVLLLIIPFIVFKNAYVALITTLAFAILIIAGYTFYITTAKNLKFWRRFLEMSIISVSVAIITFGISYAVRTLFGIEV